MRFFILTVAMSLSGLFSYGQSYNKLWKQVEQFEDEGKPKSAYDVAERIYKKAARSHHTGQTLSARLKMAALHQEWSPDSFFTDIHELEALRAGEKKPEAKAVYASLLAELYQMNRGRSQTERLELSSADIKEWTRQQYDSAASQNWRLSMQDLRVLSAAKSKDWLPFIRQEEQSGYFRHDLLHILWHRVRECDEDIWKGTRYMKSQLAQDVVSEYKRLGNREAALLVALDYVKLQNTRSEETILKELKDEYADLPLCVEVYLQLIDEISDSKMRIELARECLQRYPGYYRIGVVHNRLNDLLRPFVSWQGRSLYYPGKTYDWVVRSQNAHQLTCEILLMPADFKLRRLSGSQQECLEALRRAGRTVDTIEQMIKDDEPWVYHIDTLKWVAPAPGNYVLIVTAESKEAEVTNKKVTDYTGFICSRLQPISQNGLGKQRTIVVDAESGHPVEGASVEFYYTDDNDKPVSIATLVTDAEGRATLPNEQVQVESTRLMRKVTFGDDIYLEPEDFYFGREAQHEAERTTAHMRLYSDRSIYRPGQTVHVGGILYNALHWDAHAAANINVQLTLYDTNRKEVGTRDVTTDEMGSFSTDFVLPQGGLPGYYTISARFEAGEAPSGRASLSVNVEEYKRPTFEVKMDKAPDMHWPATSIILTGKAIGYNGVPVREGCVTGTYQFTYPWWWGSRDDSDRMPIDTLTTDENGVFSIKVPLSKLSEEALWGGLTLQVEVDVLSVAGETRQGRASVPLCKKPLRLLLTVPDQLDRDRLGNIDIQLLASTGQPTDGTVEWAIYPANQKERTSNAAVMQGSLLSKDKSVVFDVNTLRNLATGQYEFSAKATSGTESDSTNAYFLIFGMDDKRLPKVTSSWMYCPDETFNASRPARIQVGTSFEDVSFYYSVVAGNQFVEQRLITLSDEMRVIEIPYKPSYGDGATFHYIFVRGGVTYRGSQLLRLTQPENKLQWEWTSFRDRLHPGDSETWTLRLRTPDGKPASAHVMATLYDASLDAIRQHDWSFFLSRAYDITGLPLTSGANDYPNNYFTSRRLSFSMRSYKTAGMHFDVFDEQWYGGLGFHRYSMYGATRGMVMAEPMVASPVPMMAMRKNVDHGAADTMEDAEDEMADANTSASTTSAENGGAAQMAQSQSGVRQNFNETAAFLPRLITNAKGEVNISFTLPESLTTWKLLGLAHTKDMMSTTFTAKAVANKEMMARLFLPRFLRADDQASIRATVQNMTDADIQGTALLEIFDPETERVIKREQKPFSSVANGECLLTFDYSPDDAHTVVAVRLTASSKTFTDGEQHFLPILPSKTYVTESVEIRADSLGTFTTDLSSLFNHDSPTATNRRLTIEYTAHPIWYALQALPSLVVPRYDDIISLGTALQAQSLSTYIANNTPRLQTLVEIWKREQAQGQPSLSSRLAEDEDLKQIILDETPWLREAEAEADRKARLIELFNISQQEQTLVTIAKRMEKRLMADGGYSWFPGMESSEGMTRVVASELARLRVMTDNMATLPSEVRSVVNRMLSRNVSFLATKTAKHVAKMKEDEKNGETINTASLMYLEYIYMTQHAGVKLTASQKADIAYLLDHMKGSVASMSNWERAVAAVVMKGAGRNKEARSYYESLLEHTTTTADHGTFFDYAGGSFEPTSHKIIHHVAAMEAVHVMEPQNKTLRRGLQRWLLQQKRTQMWESNICTSDAIYALLLDNSYELQASQPDAIVINYPARRVEVSRVDADEAVSGLGYVKKQFADGEAPRSVTVERRTDSEAWGAAFATFLTPMTDASASATGLTVRREVSNAQPKVGDRFTTRYVITADRDYEYVCLRADRAACAEPADQLSGYYWQGGLGYYRAVRDARTEYFFDHLPKGTYVLEETAFIDRAGNYTTGLTSLRCLYAPEYGSNTAAVELKVEE